MHPSIAVNLVIYYYRQQIKENASREHPTTKTMLTYLCLNPSVSFLNRNNSISLNTNYSTCVLVDDGIQETVIRPALCHVKTMKNGLVEHN